MVSRAGKGSLSTMALSCSQAKSWVKLHYERHEEGVVAKSVMYKHYEEYCREQNRNIMETSIFGRVVKSVFPDVTIRRLGGRDNLKYYYCGIRAKETSPYAIDNTTTTRPKRRLRKRELVTDKTEVDNCLRWLHAYYVASNEASVIKTDVYDGYLNFCKQRGVEPLSIQYFGMVVTHAFPNVTKRKLGPRTNQQKYYFGISERPNPLPLELVPCEYLSNIEEVLGNNQPSYRETIETPEEEEEEDFSCRSPESDMSDISSQHGMHNQSFDPDMRTYSHLPQYPFEHYLKEDAEPVDYSLSSLRLKDEPIEEEDLIIKEEPLDLHISRDVCERRTPDRPPSVSAFVSSSSPSPPSKEPRSRRIYKPRFHYYDESSWNDDPTEDKKGNGILLSGSVESLAVSDLKNWIISNFEESKGVHVNRNQVYDSYEKWCEEEKVTVLPMTSFDETMFKVFRNVVTMIHPSRKTFYEGIRVAGSSVLYGRIEELSQDESQWAEEDNGSNAMELSPTEGSTSHSSPLTLEEEDPPDENFTFGCNPIEEDIHQTPQVLRDGKYYLRKWLTDNFHSVPDSCVLKADAYRHYDLYARSINQTPFEMNVFGKIVRQVFPNVSIRRLGGRHKPQYHYCGIAVKPSSPLYHYMSGKDPAQRSRKKEIATDNRSAEIVIEFLRRNYEAEKEKIIMKSDVFENYSSFCSSQNETPVTLNYFGKLVKHCFPNVEVRKFGGRSEPTWYYFGLVSKNSHTSYKYPAVNPSYHEMPSANDSVSIPAVDSQAIVTSAGMMPGFCMEKENLNRHSTSPIPINMQRAQMNHAGHYNSSPSFLPNYLNQSLRVSSYEDHHQDSPADNAPFFRESINPHSPAEIFYSRSPSDHPTKGHVYQVINVEATYPRETLPHHSHHKPPIFGGGQVVPSQTPPNICMAQGIDQTMALHAHKKNRRPFAIQEEFEIYNDMGME
ncbi:UNVERIFIED_CONTAM: hypothetical protein RMT77_012881 [Armadillidium vulgare]